MNDQEKQAMLAFLGTMHAQAKATDQMIVGQSQFLKPASPTIQNQFAQILQAPTSQHIEQPVQYAEPPPMMAPSPMPQQPMPQQPQVENPQLEFRFEPTPPSSPVTSVQNEKLIEILEEINLNLSRVVDILDNKNKPNARTKNPKKG